MSNQTGSANNVVTTDDLLWGAEGIGKPFGLTERQVFDAFKTKKLPIRKFGNKYVASKAECLSAILGR